MSQIFCLGLNFLFYDKKRVTFVIVCIFSNFHLLHTRKQKLSLYQKVETLFPPYTSKEYTYKFQADKCFNK